MSSKIYDINKKDLQRIVENSNSLADILRALDLHTSNGNYRPLKKRLKNDNINYDHIKLGLNANKNKTFPNKQIPLSEILVSNSNFRNSSYLKKRLLKEGVLTNECNKCGLTPIWNGEALSLQLDHINGNHNDNRLENLQILCPNCHSQTLTYSGRNSRKELKINYCNCGEIISKNSKHCRKCASLDTTIHPPKIVWPNQEELLKMINESNYVQVGKQLGVSDNAVRKRIKNH